MSVSLPQYTRNHHSLFPNPLSLTACTHLDTSKSTPFYIGFALSNRRAPHPASTSFHILLLPLAAWRSCRASLYRCTRRETVTWAVTELIFNVCPFHSTPYNDKQGPPSVPSWLLAAGWSMSSLSSPPRRPTFFTVKVTSLWLLPVKDTCSTNVRSGCIFAPQKWRQLTHLDQRCYLQPACVWILAHGYAYMTSRGIALFRNSDDVAHRIPRFSTTMSLRRSLLRLNGTPLSS